MLKIVKEATKEPENGGYELIPTVPLSKISTLYFKDSQEFRNLVTLLNDSPVGLIGLTQRSSNAIFGKIFQNYFWVKGAELNLNGEQFYRIKPLKNTVNSYESIFFYLPNTYDTKINSWSDSELKYGASYYEFSTYDYFEAVKKIGDGINPLARGTYIVSKTGVSLPVFNTINDAIAYSVEHNLYYTSSDYTGEGKEIIIPLDEIDKILNGYYSGMYDLLQQLIEQNGGNALTPEQLQKLVDEVKASFGMIQDTIDKGFAEQDILIQKNSQILQNIADALNKFFSQSKESRTAFLKEFKDYAKDQQTRDDALYKLISDYIESTKNNNPDTSEPSLPPPPDPGDNTDTTDSSAWHEKLYNTIKKGFDDVVNGLKQGFSSVVDELKKIKRWTALDTILDGAGAVGEWVSLLTDLLDPEKRLGTLTDFVGTAMDALNDTTNLVKGKFPFCIPVDILALMQTLSA